jgi:hypothetical protein
LAEAIKRFASGVVDGVCDGRGNPVQVAEESRRGSVDSTRGGRWTVPCYLEASPKAAGVG